MSDLSERLRAEANHAEDFCENDLAILLRAAASRLDYLTSVEGRRDWLGALETLREKDLAPISGRDRAECLCGFYDDRLASWFLRSPPEVQAAVCRLVDAKLEAKRHD